MVFSDNIFLFFFLPCVIFFYKLARHFLNIKWANYVLLFFSLIFYGWGEPKYVFLMINIILINYTFGLVIAYFDNKKPFLAAAVAVNVGFLAFFKYIGLFDIKSLPEIVLPVGISFYIFQSLSYVIDVYRGETVVQTNPFIFGTYVALFPQLIAGPIVRYRDIESQLFYRSESLPYFSSGVVMFIYGLSKKLLLANPMGLAADELLLNESGMLSGWFGIICYTLQIYFDFSGYSDMALGLGRMFGFSFNLNFNYPYISQSVKEFWSRWHISLSTWFREYVYIPLGGNRKGPVRQCINLLIVWALTGMWHGATPNFLLWGLYYGVLLILEKFVFCKFNEKIPKAFRHLITMLIVTIGWGIFYFTDINSLGSFALRLLSFGKESQNSLCYMGAYLPTVLIGCLFSTPIPMRIMEKLHGSDKYRIGEFSIVFLLFLLCVATMVSSSYNPFIYFRF